MNRQVAILSRAKNFKNIKVAKGYDVGSQVLRLEQPEAEATFVGPLRLTVATVKTTSMSSVKDPNARRDVEFETSKREILIPSGHQFPVKYQEWIGAAADGCLGGSPLAHPPPIWPHGG